EMGQVIHDSGKRLERLIENFLIFAQLELLGADAQKVSALRHQQTRSPAKLIAERARNVAASAKRPGDLDLQLADRPLPISEDYLGKIVEELVQNAFKFSRPGGRVGIALTETPESFVFSVSDQGRGFTPEHLTKIGVFMQFDRKMHEQQGLGLGLSIAKRMTELHGGTLTIQSEPGVASKVTVKLPKALTRDGESFAAPR